MSTVRGIGRHLVLGAAMSGLAVVAGCNLIWSDDYTWRGLWVANETESRVLITSDRMGWRFITEAGQTAVLWAASGPFPTDLDFVSADCTTFDSVMIAATEDTLVRVTGSGVDVVTDPDAIPRGASVLPQASAWPCE